MCLFVCWSVVIYFSDLLLFSWALRTHASAWNVGTWKYDISNNFLETFKIYSVLFFNSIFNLIIIATYYRGSLTQTRKLIVKSKLKRVSFPIKEKSVRMFSLEFHKWMLTCWHIQFIDFGEEFMQGFTLKKKQTIKTLVDNKTIMITFTLYNLHALT